MHRLVEIESQNPRPPSLRLFFLLTRRCLLGSIFLHQDMENETDTSDKACGLKPYWKCLLGCIFMHRLVEIESQILHPPSSRLFFYLLEVSVRAHFPAPGHGK